VLAGSASGHSRSRISEIETGHTLPSGRFVELLHRAYGIDPAIFFEP
jgi:hypothetical protein